MKRSGCRRRRGRGGGDGLGRRSLRPPQRQRRITSRAPRPRNSAVTDSVMPAVERPTDGPQLIGWPRSGRRRPGRNRRPFRLGGPVGHAAEVPTEYGSTGQRGAARWGWVRRQPAPRLRAVPERANDTGVRCALRRFRDTHQSREASHGTESACGLASRSSMAHGPLEP